MNIFGKIHHVGQVVEHSDRFKSAKFVVETQDQYPQKLQFQLTNSKTELTSKLKVGQFAKIHFNLKSNEWKGNYYTNLNAWKIEIGKESPAEEQNSFDKPIKQSEELEIEEISLEDDLEF